MQPDISIDTTYHVTSIMLQDKVTKTVLLQPHDTIKVLSEKVKEVHNLLKFPKLHTGNENEDFIKLEPDNLVGETFMSKEPTVYLLGQNLGKYVQEG